MYSDHAVKSNTIERFQKQSYEKTGSEFVAYFLTESRNLIRMTVLSIGREVMDIVLINLDLVLYLPIWSMIG